MGELAIVFAIFSVGHSLAILIRQNGVRWVGQVGSPQNRISSFWAFAFGLAALGFGIAGVMT